jgi:hypothetical protein
MILWNKCQFFTKCLKTASFSTRKLHLNLHVLNLQKLLLFNCKNLLFYFAKISFLTGENFLANDWAWVSQTVSSGKHFLRNLSFFWKMKARQNFCSIFSSSFFTLLSFLCQNLSKWWFFKICGKSKFRIILMERT